MESCKLAFYPVLLSFGLFSLGWFYKQASYQKQDKRGHEDEDNITFDI
jgi:hypothetical protein